ncbi:hypothetical protein ABFY60_00590 [Lysinibacillus pakistanensis]|uniref:hypothetical protein n=1 Tax=Lysinibacillus pakistanensis TaxID=759811 RepID=UPI003D2D377F
MIPLVPFNAVASLIALPCLSNTDNGNKISAPAVTTFVGAPNVTESARTPQLPSLQFDRFYQLL